MLPPARAEIQVGAAVRVITPDPLLPVSGGMGTPNPTREKRGEITARAIVFRKGDVSVAVVSLDLIGFPSVLGDRVRAKVSRIPADHILIGSTHTHSAPDCYAFPDGKGGHTGDLNYMDSVCDKAAEAVNEAIDRLQPAWIKIATGEAQGKIAYNYYAPDLYDRRMSVIQAVSPKGKTIATLVNYAIHPEVLGNDIGILSPDLVGPLCEKIESQAGGTALFMNSAQGGMVTADNRDLDQPRDQQRAYWNDSRSWDECLRIGHLMATEALRIIKDAPDQKDPTLFCDSINVRFPVDSMLMWGVILGLAAQVSAQRRPVDQRADQSGQPGHRPDPHDPRRGPAQYRLLSQAQDARQEQPAVRPDQRSLRLHLDEGRFPELSPLRLRLAHVARRDDGRDPDREVARTRQQIAGAGSMSKTFTCRRQGLGWAVPLWHDEATAYGSWNPTMN